MVETPHDKMYLAVDSNKFLDSDDPLPLKQSALDPQLADHEPELLLVKRPMITSSLRLATKHLIAQGGYLAVFRGFGIFASAAVLAHICREFFNQCFFKMMRMPFPISTSLSSLIATMAIYRLMLTWTHIIMTQPSSKWWIRRLPSLETARKIAPATALCALADQLAIAVPFGLACGLGLHHDLFPGKAKNIDETSAKVFMLKIFTVFFVFIAGFFLLSIPAHVTLARVQASLLPETDETIVPFDRTFNGKFVPESAGGSGKLGLLDAWRTFDGAARRRLLKLIFKILAIDMGMGFALGLILVGELRLVMGDTFDKMVSVVGAWMLGSGGQ